MKKPDGFTLIELLVVISIIAILSTVGFVSFQNVRKNALDAKIRADIDAIKKAYETNFDPSANGGQGGYKKLSPSDDGNSPYFASGKIPTQPNGAPYACIVGPDAGCASIDSSQYQITAQISDTTAPAVTATSNQGVPVTGGDAAASKLVVADTFDRAENTTLGTTEYGNKPWQVKDATGADPYTWGISNNQAYQLSADTDSKNHLAGVDMGANFNGTMIVTISQLKDNGRIFFRTDNTISSGYALQSGSNGNFKIFRGSDDTWRQSMLLDTPIFNINNVIVKIVVSTSATTPASVTIDVYIGPDKILPSAPSITYTDTNPASLRGVLWGLGSIGYNGVTYDNFSISSL